MYNVPSEIILAIAEHLRLDISHRTTLSSLCLVDKRTYHLAKVYLYRHVELNSNSAITKFRQTLTVLCPYNAVHVNTLNVYPLIWHTRACSSNRIRKDLVPDLRSILNVVSNLKHLYLAITRKALVLLLADIKPVFSLYSMAHSGDMSKPLLKFLSNQPEIVNHGWYSLSSWKMCRLLQESMTQDNRFLGNLRSAIGPANFLAALMRRRPLTSITILIYTWRYKNTKLDDASASCGGVTGWVKAMYEAYAGGIGLIPPRESLKEIRIAETQLPMVGAIT
ncbi:unnamed protein product [Rhizoctonia solani]|uniref:Uncharacterized protein n=2 Tax=Rhizoctonia solani TaxID=456999 RepID=A0A8H3BAA0_9AGAM|nr:unnamed protein product [Rhizoctonia solani]